MPSELNSDALIPLTSALVPTATKAGVCISPCGVLKMPARARPGPSFCMSNLLFDTNQLYLKNQCRVCRYRAVVFIAVRHVRRDDEQALSAYFHTSYTQLPSRYYMPLPERKLDRRFAGRCVKHRAVLQFAGVLHAYQRARNSFRAGADNLVLHDKPGVCCRRCGVHNSS